MRAPGALRDPWIGGRVAGGSVIAIAAGLLVTIIVLARKITGQANDTTRALDASRENTTALFAVDHVNDAIARITRDLRAVREGIEAQ